MLNMCNWNMLNMYKPMRNTQMTCMIGPLTWQELSWAKWECPGRTLAHDSFKRSPSHPSPMDQVTNAPRSYTMGDTTGVRTAHA